MNTLSILRLLAVGLAVITLSSCDGLFGPEPPPNVRALSPAEQKIVTANVDFSVRLFQELHRTEGAKNMFFSPYSYMQALSMASNGAANATRDSILKALQFHGVSMEEINEGARSLNEYLLGLDRNVELRIANGIWHNNQFIAEQPFLNAVRQSFGAEVRGMAFGRDAVKDDINRWVEGKTNNRIKNLIQQEFSADDLMCLVNAVYFNALWKARFEEANTKDEPFKRENGSSLVCKMMNLTKETNVQIGSLPNAQVIDIPYSSGQFTMTVILPREGERLSSVIQSLTPASLQTALSQMSSTATLLAMPKFSMQTRYEETPANPRELHRLGMGLAFSRAADFSQMYRPPLRAAVSFVIHQTFLQVDERGTEAAAATAVGIELTSAPFQPRIIRFDRPFAFFIREKSSKVILFAGTLYEPKI